MAPSVISLRVRLLGRDVVEAWALVEGARVPSTPEGLHLCVRKRDALLRGEREYSWGVAQEPSTRVLTEKVPFTQRKLQSQCTGLSARGQ